MLTYTVPTTQTSRGSWVEPSKRLLLLIAGAVATVVAVSYLLAPPMGPDFAAQLAHAELAEKHWPALLDLRWYGGYHPLGYSVLSPPLTALIGVRAATALGYIASVVLFAAVLKRVGAIRPVAGAVVGALCFTGNLANTRTAFMLGVAAGLAALVALTYQRTGTTVMLAVIAGLTSPVAGLFLGICGAAVALVGSRRHGLALAVGALIPTIAVGLLFGNGGQMNYALHDAKTGFVLCLLAAALCWDRPVVLWGALLAIGLITAAYLFPTPVGKNADRLPEIFALPVIVAVTRAPRIVLATVGVVLLAALPLRIVDAARGDRALNEAFYAPLLEELTNRQVVGPIEVVPQGQHGETAFVAARVPLARGWLRQVDIGRNPVFYDGTLDARTYREWLDDNAISWVAIAHTPHDWAGYRETTLIRNGLAYLHPVWSDQTWTLLAVMDPQPLVSTPGRVVARDDVSMTIALPEPGTYDVRIRWSRFLSASAGCVRPSPDGWTVLVTDQPSTVRLHGSLLPHRCAQSTWARDA
jgi:hypothetical protein